MVQTVTPPGAAGLFCGALVGVGKVGVDKGSAVFVGKGVAVGMIWVGGGFNVAAGIGVRVGRRVGVGAGVGVGSGLQPIDSASKAMRAINEKMPRGIEYSKGDVMWRDYNTG